MLKKSFSRVRRQPTPRPSQEGKIGDRRQPTPRPSTSQEGRNGNERGGRSGRFVP
ncbi:MAG: hypothetical protein F6K48_21110 [Okeania sp. SIO3H1]|nr:hypothetical protein [Okeania sp. SIO3H1]